MTPLRELIIKYEQELTEIEFKKFAELLGVSKAKISAKLSDKIKCYETVLTFAESRNIDGETGDLAKKELAYVISHMRPYGYIIPGSISRGAIDALENVINERVKFYQDLLNTKGEFEKWQDLFKAKYHSGNYYLQAVNALALSERKVEDFQDEIAGATDKFLAGSKLKTKENEARNYARQQISIAFYFLLPFHSYFF